MFGEECTLHMDVGLPCHDTDSPDHIHNPYALWVRDALEVAYDQVRCHAGQVVRRHRRLYDQRAVRPVFTKGDWTMRWGVSGLGKWKLGGKIMWKVEIRG